MNNLQPLLNFHPRQELTIQELVEFLSTPQKTLPSKLFYDSHGSKLFDQICNLPEYYLTRTEQRIMDSYADDMAAYIGEAVLLVELGSGSSLKTRVLLENLRDPAGYVPLDISPSHLEHSAARIAARFPGIEVLPVCADYENSFGLPRPKKNVNKTVVFFPGSTIGNFHPSDATAFFKHIRRICGNESEMLIGVDLKKDVGLLHRAYNDCEGVTADFNKNILVHLNNLFGIAFNLDKFEHVAFYNEIAGRIEMHLRSTEKQAIPIDGVSIELAKDECIWTESSYKYSLKGFEEICSRAGFQIEKVWTDPNRLFSVQYMTPMKGQDQ